MKKIVFIAALAMAAMAVSCGNANKTTENADSTVVAADSLVLTQEVDSLDSLQHIAVDSAETDTAVENN